LIRAAVEQRFGDMLAGDALCAGEVGDSARDPRDAVEGPRT
jgi:hypothetical protein